MLKIKSFNIQKAHITTIDTDIMTDFILTITENSNYDDILPRMSARLEHDFFGCDPIFYMVAESDETYRHFKRKVLEKIPAVIDDINNKFLEDRL